MKRETNFNTSNCRLHYQASKPLTKSDENFRQENAYDGNK